MTFDYRIEKDSSELFNGGNTLGVIGLSDLIKANKGRCFLPRTRIFAREAAKRFLILHSRRVKGSKLLS